MKTIFHLIVGLNQGGAEAMLYKLLQGMDNSQFKNIVISMTDMGVYGEKIRNLGIPVYTLNMKKNLHTFRWFSQYCQLIRTHKPDIVQAWMYHANALAILAKICLPEHRVFFNIRRGLDSFQKLKVTTRVIVKLNAYLSSFANVVINNSQRSQQQHHNFGFTTKNAIYIPNGFNLSHFHPNEKMYSDFRKQYNLPKQAKIIGMVARFHPDKNQKGFIETATRIIATLPTVPVYFILAGKDCNYDNALLSTWLQRANLGNKILLLDTVDSAELLPAFDVYLSTSRVEGFPNVIGEAMACGVPCVATDVGDCKTIIGNLGFVTTVGDYDELAQKVCALLNGDKDEHFIRQHIIDRYSIDTVVAAYTNLYSDLS